MSDVARPEAITDVDEIKRTSGPRTTDGKRWEVQLSGIPSRGWLDLFKSSRESSDATSPRRLDFDRACVVFSSDEHHVAAWVESIDRWIAATNARHRLNLERASRERYDRLAAGTREQERIQQLNDRFKDL